MARILQTQWAVSGLVEASVEDVWQALLNNALHLPAGDKQTLLRHEDSVPFTITLGRSGEGRTRIVVDKRQHHVTIEGEWWYRGVTLVEPHQYGSLIAYRVFNIAPGYGWWIAQLVQGPERARVMKDYMQQLLNSISGQLQCTAHLIDTGT